MRPAAPPGNGNQLANECKAVEHNGARYMCVLDERSEVNREEGNLFSLPLVLHLILFLLSEKLSSFCINK
jgi:hypothetical protein